MDSLLQDIRYALRSLAKSPGFTAITLVTLALGIGANSAIFSVVNGVLIRPLPYPDADRLVVARETYSGDQTGSVSGANFIDWRDRARSFQSMTASWGVSMSLIGAGEPQDLPVALASAEFFTTLGVTPIKGRGFLPGEDQGQATVAVISETLWRNQFGADSGIRGTHDRSERQAVHGGRRRPGLPRLSRTNPGVAAARFRARPGQQQGLALLRCGRAPRAFGDDRGGPAGVEHRGAGARRRVSRTRIPGEASRSSR